MVIVRLVGGLGNQMFQYAAGRAIAARCDSRLRLDLSPFEKYSLHAYGLASFNIQAEIASASDVERIEAAHRRSPVARATALLPALRPLCRNLVVDERHFHFDPGIVRLGGNVYLKGYWQSAKYFEDVASLIRHELTVRIPPSQLNEEMALRIRHTESISLHVRRGDYVSNADTHAVHGVCGVDYYRAAIAHLAGAGVRPEVFVFSDDPDWALEHLQLGIPTTVVRHNDTGKNFEDFRLMSLCKHHITANSSFSWWAAWLGDHPGKRVVAPREWFRTTELNTADLIPAGWARL